MFTVLNKEKITKLNDSKIKNNSHFFITNQKSEEVLELIQPHLINGMEVPYYTNNIKNSNLPTKQTTEELKNSCVVKEITKNQSELIKEKEENEGKEKTKDNIENIEKEIKEIIIQEEQKKFGRKRIRLGYEGKHNKYADDNLRRKVKHIILEELFEFINNKISVLYNGHIGHGISTKKLLTLNHKPKANTIVKYNQEFLQKTLKDIFSENISSRYTNYLKEHNKILIEKLLNEDDESKRKYFTNLFNLTFLESLEHFRGTEFYEELSGLKGFNEIIEQYDDEPDYKICLVYYINKFEEIINNKRSRKPRKDNLNEKLQTKGF